MLCVLNVGIVVEVFVKNNPQTSLFVGLRHDLLVVLNSDRDVATFAEAHDMRLRYAYVHMSLGSSATDNFEIFC